MAFTIVDAGSFTSDGSDFNLPMESGADWVVLKNMTQLPLAPNPGVVVMSEWYGSFFGDGASASNDGVRWKKTNSSNALNVDTFATATASNGFTYVSSIPYVSAQAANAITAITAASPAVVSQTNTYAEDDIVRLYSTTGMLQVAGLPVQISSVSGSGYTLKGLRGAGFAAAATAGYTRKLSKYAAIDPQYLYITEITQANQAVVRTSIDPSRFYVVGMKTHFNIPSSFGMQEMNQQTGVITAVSSSDYTVTVDINSSSYSAFAFPASSASPNAALFATLAPAGQYASYNPLTMVQTGYDFVKAPFGIKQYSPFLICSGGAQSPAGAANDVINWVSYKFETA